MKHASAPPAGALCTAALLAMVLAGCGKGECPPGSNPDSVFCHQDDAGESDAGPSDAGDSDAGPSDAGEADAGPSDAGEADAGPSDAGEADAGVMDAGCTPAAETCNGVDDDCDDAIDDGVPPGGACSAGIGACASAGVFLCASGTYSSCDAVAGSPAVESCNGIDDDCNGAVDNGACDVTEIAASNYHTCARRSAGAVVCWGRNADGQLGDGTTTQRLTPTAVSGLIDAVELTVGVGQHSCARRSSGAVACWGSNLYGQLGDGTGVGRLMPTPVSGLADAVEISSGYFHTCARRASGSVVCWGRNLFGELGDGTTTQRLAPVAVSGLADAVEISAGGSHTCARRATGAIVCWGGNSVGAIGDGTTVNRATPTAVPGIIDAVELSAGGNHQCARRAGGTLLCWGRNVEGEVGDGTISASRLSPTPVPGVTDAVEISAGYEHSCARRSAGTVVCWGRNDFGELGDGTGTRRLTPTAVSGLGDAVEITTGNYHTCARRSAGAIACWGSNGDGRLGDGTTMSRLTPTPVVGL